MMSEVSVRRLFTYILRHDSGFAPNPFWGHCTLACCKPVIRRQAAVGDIVVGITPKQHGHGLAYAMEVSETLLMADYWRDPRLAAKKPRWQSPTLVNRCGDNCYEPLKGGGFRQLPSTHSNPDGTENAASKERDLGGQRVLIASRFWYFGANAVTLPRKLAFAIAGRGHRCQFTPGQIQAFLAFLSRLPLGMQGPPARWKTGDSSYRQAGVPIGGECR
jgi:hypothetical protein